MKHFNAIIVTVMLGLAVTLLPKASWASDVSVGVFFGIPFPVVAIAPPPIHHPVPGFFIPPPPVHPRVYTHRPNFRQPQYVYKHVDKHDDRGYRGRNYEKHNWGRGNDDQQDDDRGNYGRGNDHRR